MTAYLYLRVSTEEQVSNLSLDTQEQECRALCAKNDWSVAEVFREEGASAKTLDRPTLQRLLAQLGRAKGKVTHVVVLRVDRLSRNRDDFYVLRAALRRHGVRIVSVREEIADDSISSMIVETFSVLQAQVDNLIRAGRAKTGMTEAARRGRWVWKAPIGYRHAPHRDGRPVGLEKDPDQAPHVARAFDLVAAGVAVDAAFRECTAAGLKGSAGKPLGRQTFHAIFRKPIYAGRLEVATWGIEVESAAPAIVTPELFAQARLAIASRTPVRRQTATLDDFPLRGLTRCACGTKLAAYHAKGKSGRTWPYYRCQRCEVHTSSRDLLSAFERLLGRVDRLSRNRDDFYVLRAALRRHGVRIVSVREEIADDSISSMIVETFSVLQAQVDNLIRAGRAKTGMTEAARRGRWVWKAPIGYRHAPHRDGRPVGLEKDPDQAPHVARAFDLVAAGVAVDAAFRECTAAGLKGSAGKPLGRQTFHAIFRKPIYAGRLEVATWGIEVESAAPAIVTPELFAQARLAIASRTPVRRQTATLDDFPLRGLTRCACGTKLAAYHAKGKSGRTWPYYRCQRCEVHTSSRDLLSAFERLLGRVDRLSRNRDDFYVLRAALRRHGVRIVSVREEIADDSISSMIVETFSVLQAQVDNLIRAGRAKTGMTEAARRGRWVWKAPIGYRHAPHRDGRPVGLEKDPDQAPHVARAFDLVAAGVAVDAAFRECTAAGLKGSAGKPLGRQTFHAIFRKPIYAGRLEVATWGIEVESAAPAIVTPELFAQARLAIASRTPVRRQTATLDDFPLRGLTRCACGTKLAAYHAKGKSGRTWPYYRCQRCEVHTSSRDLLSAFERLLGRVDRLSRNRDDFYVLRAALRRHGVRIVSVREEIADDSISSMIVETFSVLQAQVDNLIRAGRAKTGMTEAARRGRWVWKAPIGYRHAPHRDGRPVGLEKDPDQAPHVARAFDLVAAGVAVDAAFRECTAAGLKGSAGKPLGRQTFHAIFRKPIYAGRLEVATWGIEVESAAPAIVTPELFAQARLAIASRTPVRRQTATLDDFPLRGLTRCACGTKLAAYHAKGKSGRTWPYYRCQRCEVHTSSRDLLSAFERLLGRVAAPEAMVLWVDRLISQAIDQRAAEMESRLAKGRRQLATAEGRLDRLLAMRVDGEIAPEEFAQARERISLERDAARAELAELTTPLDADFAVASSWAKRLLTRPTDVWAELEPSLRATFVERVFPEGLTFKEGEFANPANCLLTLPLEEFSMVGNEMVRHPGSSANPERIVAWSRSLRRAERFMVKRAA